MVSYFPPLLTAATATSKMTTTAIILITKLLTLPTAVAFMLQGNYSWQFLVNGPRLSAKKLG